MGITCLNTQRMGTMTTAPMGVTHLEVLEEALGEDVVAEPGHLVQGSVGLAPGLLALGVPELRQPLSKGPAAGRSVGAARDPEHPRDAGRGTAGGGLT